MVREGFVLEGLLQLLDLNIGLVADPSKFLHLILFEDLMRLAKEVINKHGKVVAWLLSSGFVILFKVPF